MPRIARSDAAGALHHVTARGIERGEKVEKGQVNNTQTIKIHIHWGTGRSLITAHNDRDNRSRVISAERFVGKECEVYAKEEIQRRSR